MNRFAAFLVVVAAALWGVDGIVLTPTLYSLPVPFVVLMISLIVSIILLPIPIKQFSVIKNLTIKDWAAFIGVGLFGGAIGTMAITKALFYVDFVNLSIVVLIQKLQPLFAIILAGIVLKEKLSKDFFFWASVSIIGAYIMTFDISLPNFNTGDKTLEASAFALLAAFAFASSTVLSKRALKNIGFETGTYLRFFITSLIMLLIVLPSGDYSAVEEITNKQWLVFGIIAVTTGGPAIFLYYYGLKRIPASIATICELAMPLTAIVLEYIIHDNFLSPVQWVGVLVLLFGIFRITNTAKHN